MDRSAITSILRELNIHEDSVANIYNYGSWVYGTNSASSDRDILIVTHSTNNTPLTFHDELDYFHEFELHKLWNQYDVCIHTAQNFEILLEKNYLLAVECIFLPAEFKIKEDIDFQKIYLEKYYNKLLLKKAAFYENYTATKMYDLEDNSIYPVRSTETDETSESSKNYLFKNLFHGYRYLDFVEQLIQTKSIHDFKRVSHILNEMKEIRDNPDDGTSWYSVLDFIQKKSTEYKSKLDTLVPTNIIQGTFEAHVTFECTYHTEQAIDQLKNICQNSKFKIIFIDLYTHRQQQDKLQQLMTSSYHCGEYPSIVKQIEEEVYKRFQDFNITRIKIESLASNTGVPETTIDKKLFWDNRTNYFEFHYKVLVKKHDQGGTITHEKLVDICRKSYSFHLRSSRNAFKQLDNDDCHYMVTMRSLEFGRTEAFQQNEEAIAYLTRSGFPPLKVVREFIVYDTRIELDDKWM